MIDNSNINNLINQLRDILSKQMRARITVYFSWGTFDYPSSGSDYFIGRDDDPKKFLEENLSHYLLSPLDSWSGASVFKYLVDGYGKEKPIELIKYKINRVKYNLTKQAEFLLEERTRFD